MSVSDDARKEMLRELLEFNAVPVARPGDLTARDVMEAVKAEGGSLSRTQAYRWLNNMVETAGWKTAEAMVNGRRAKVWRKPATKDKEA